MSYRKVDGSRPIVGAVVAVPRNAIRAFTFEGKPSAIHVTDKQIGVRYAASGVVFDRKSGTLVRRLTVREGWPATAAPPFGSEGAHDKVQWIDVDALGSCRYAGVRQCAEVKPVSFGGCTWRAVQHDKKLTDAAELGFKDMEYLEGGWSTSLSVLSKHSFIAAKTEPRNRGSKCGRPRRFTVQNGLAGNITTHLVVAQGALWAASLAIYDPSKKQWTAGGLSRFDSKSRRWKTVTEILGQPVQFVSLLQAVDGDLWVGFRQGDGVLDDRLCRLRCYELGQYRPRCKRIVLARLSSNKWEVFHRPPVQDPPLQKDPPSAGIKGLRTAKRAPMDRVDGRIPPTEQPVVLAQADDTIILVSHKRLEHTVSGLSPTVQISALHLPSGRWELFDSRKVFTMGRPLALASSKGEVMLTTNRGVQRWIRAAGGWQLLDPRSPLPHPHPNALAAFDGGLWVGFTNTQPPASSRSYLWRYNSTTGRWKDAAPEKVGVDCPVKSLAVLKGRELWALFKQRVWPVNVHGRDPSLPRYSFHRCSDRRNTPSVLRYRNGRWEQPAELERVLPEPHGTAVIQEIAASGNSILAWDLEGAWIGPEKWRRNPSPGMPKPPSARRWTIFDLHQIAHRTGKQDHRTMLVHRSRKWAVGPLGGPVTETAGAYWVAMHSQLLRLDKAGLNKGVRDLPTMKNGR